MSRHELDAGVPPGLGRSVFDEGKQTYTNLSLFADDRTLPEDPVDSIQVRLSGLELRRPRPFGNCWLATGRLRAPLCKCGLRNIG